jgi:hypothetical protein
MYAIRYTSSLSGAPYYWSIYDCWRPTLFEARKYETLFDLLSDESVRSSTNTFSNIMQAKNLDIVKLGLKPPVPVEPEYYVQATLGE